MGHARRAPLRAPHVAGAASAADLPGIDPQAAAGLLAQRPRGASSPGPDPSMLKSVDIAAQLLLAGACSVAAGLLLPRTNAARNKSLTRLCARPPRRRPQPSASASVVVGRLRVPGSGIASACARVGSSSSF